MPTLDWIGKNAVVGHHKEVPYRLIKCDKDFSAGEAGEGNLLVEGDNLHALKALLPYYGGKVKCIYIDPPYNTGNEGWIYNDNVNSPEIKKWLGQVVGREAEDLSRHDKWLCMMYPRLVLLRLFLQEDGVAFISIDDNELTNLRLITEEIFGAGNVLATVVWEKGKKGDAKFFSVNHEYILAVARSKAKLIELNTKWRRRKAGADKVLTHYAELRKKHGSNHDLIREIIMKWYRALPADDPAKAHKHYNWSDDRGLYFAADFAGPDDGRENRPRYDIFHPVTNRPVKKPSTGWRWEEARTIQALAENPPRIHFGPDEKTIPCRKSYLFEIDSEPFPSVFYKDGRAATLEVESILGKGAFEFPKDTEIIAELISMVTNQDDLILDSFGGSGTTGHAVLRQNVADNGKRRFILVELDVTTCREKTAARLNKVISGYGDTPGLGGGFRYCTLAEPLFDERGQINSSVKFSDLAHHVFFTETGEPMPKRPDKRTPLLGVHNGRAIYLLFNGILGDKQPQGGNVLTNDVLKILPPHAGARVIYGTACRLSANRLKREGVTFRQIPYEIKTT